MHKIYHNSYSRGLLYTTLFGTAGYLMKKAASQGADNTGSYRPKLFEESGISTKIPPLNPDLRVELVQAEEYPHLRGLLTDWKEAIKQMKKASPRPSIKEQNRLYESDRMCYLFLETIKSESLKKNPFSLRNHSIFACKDTSNNTQALMLLEIEEKNVYIDLLLSNPKNLISLNPVRGAGTMLVNHAENVTIKEKREKLYLDPVDSATDFYLKCGFSWKKNQFEKTAAAIKKKSYYPTVE